MKNPPLQIGDLSIHAGERISLALPTPEFYTCVHMHIPIHIIHGKKPGPCLLICAAFHGDEANGIAIIERFLEQNIFKSLNGTIIAVPVVNIYGLIAQSRTLPDGRDLEWSFPGEQAGSFAARLAHLFNHKILQKADVCIDLRSGNPHLNKLPQIITDLDIKDAKNLAISFQAPMILHTKEDTGLLFLMHEKSFKKIPTLIFEGGEPLRYNEGAIRTGLKGINNVLRYLGMISSFTRKQSSSPPVCVEAHEWIYSPSSGLCKFYKNLGSYVKKGELVAKISDPFGTKQTNKLSAPTDGIVIAEKTLPLVNEGEPLLHIAHHREVFEITSNIHYTESSREKEK